VYQFAWSRIPEDCYPYRENLESINSKNELGGWKKKNITKSSCNSKQEPIVIISLTHLKYLKLLQHVSDHNGSIIRELYTVLG